jgi:hypothetical protein
MIKLQEKAVQMFFQAILSEKKNIISLRADCWKIKSSDPVTKTLFYQAGQYSLPY